MNELKPWYREPQFIITVLFNLYILIEYQQDPSIARSVVILYWWQSVVLGISHFIQLLTAKQILPMEVNGVMRTDSGVKWSMAIFFLVHYGIFHIVYLVFLMAFVKFPDNGIHQIPAMSLAMVLLFAGVLMSLPGQIAFNRRRTMNMGTMFFSPYLRIIPMHLLILGGAWLNKDFDVFYLFMFLKFGADLFTDWMYRRKWPQWHPEAAG